MIRLLDFLPVGRENAVTARELASLLDMTGRDISRQVERLRAEGVPVCASCDSARPGYYLSESPEDLERYISSLDRRLRAVRRTRAALAETLDRETGQISISFGGDIHGRQTGNHDIL